MVTSAAGGSGTGVAVTLLGSPGKRQKVQQITWSYSATPTGGRLSTTGLEGTELDFDITAGGPGGVPLPPSSYGKVGANVTITLAAGGGSVIPKINVFSEVE